MVIPKWDSHPPLTSPPTPHKPCFPPPIHLSCLSLACVFLYKTLSHTHRWPHVGVSAQAECVFCGQRCYNSKCKCKQWWHCPSALIHVPSLFLSIHGSQIWKHPWRAWSQSEIGDLRALSQCSIETACPCSSVRHTESGRDKTWALRIQSITRDKEKWRQRRHRD